MEEKLDLKELFSYITHKWILLVVFAFIFAVVLNVYGYHSAAVDQAAAVALHKEYENAAAELPGYYTEELFRLRSNLNDNSAAFCEAYADIYKNYLTAYKSGTLTTDSPQLQAYMMFLDSYKDVLSVMSGNERSYYNALISANTEKQSESENHPIVEPYTPPVVSRVQPKWLILGIMAGLIACAVGVSVPFVFKKK